jgi:nickel-dependent lactate racemase
VKSLRAGLIALCGEGMRIGIEYGLDHVELEVPEQQVVGLHRQPAAPALPDPAAAVRAALESPRGFPALRKALTPDDHVAVVVDERLPRLPELVIPVLEHVMGAGVAAKAIALVCPPAEKDAGWRDKLPAAFAQVALQRHDPTNRKRLSYLATTRKGRRIYLNRTVVDADQVVVLARRRYDPVLGYSGSEGSLYPALSDDATRKELAARWTSKVPGEDSWPVHREAEEVAWLLGAPFMVQVIEGACNDVIDILGGLADTGAEGQRLLDARWRVTAEKLADNVIASVSGNPAHHDFADLAQALTVAARVVKPDGRIVLLTKAKPALSRGADLLRQLEDPEKAAAVLKREAPLDMTAALEWASAAQQANLYLLSDLPAATVEELFATPLDNAEQVQRLVSGVGTCLFLPDAHKSLAVVQ